MTTLTVKHKPYPVYKPSGVEWLSNVPEHWEVAAVKRQFSIQLGKMLQNTPNGPANAEVSYLKAQHVQWFQVVTANIPTMWANQYETIKFGIQQGDLLVCEGGEGGRCAILHQQIDNCIIQNALHRVRSRGQSLNTFLQYVLSTVNAVGWFGVLNDKATIAHFTKEKFDALMTPSPPFAEQRAIAAFLDRETAKIDALISKKERLIELLQEKRIALISHTVTAGLNTDASMKDSGIKWIGEMPFHWELKRLKFLARIEAGQSPPSETVSDDTNALPFLQGNAEFGAVNPIPKFGCETAPKRCQPGDILLSVRAPVGALNISDQTYGIGRGLCAVQPYSDLLGQYIYYLLFTARSQLNGVATGSTYDAVTVGDVGSMWVILPPFPEQRAIAAFLDRETAKLGRLIAMASTAIELLKELRMALISAAVTGKIDVREETECT